MARLTLQTLGDDSGHKLEDQVTAVLERVEADIQRYIDEHDGEYPTGKPYEVHVKLGVEALGAQTRRITWGVEVKFPASGQKYSQLARSEEGALMVADWVRQERLPLERVTKAEDWESDQT